MPCVGEDEIMKEVLVFFRSMPVVSTMITVRMDIMGHQVITT